MFDSDKSAKSDTNPARHTGNFGSSQNSLAAIVDPVSTELQENSFIQSKLDNDENELETSQHKSETQSEHQ